MRHTCRPGTPCSVLLIEDDPVIPALLRDGVRVYEPGCFMIETATNLADVVPKLEGISYDVIALDLGLPKRANSTERSDGVATLQVVKKLVGEKIPIVVLTGSYDAEVELSCFEVGAVEYLTKPFDTPRVLMRFRHAILRHRRIAALQRELIEEVDLLRAVESKISGDPQITLHEAANVVLRVAQSFGSGA